MSKWVRVQGTMFCYGTVVCTSCIHTACNSKYFVRAAQYMLKAKRKSMQSECLLCLFFSYYPVSIMHCNYFYNVKEESNAQNRIKKTKYRQYSINYCWCLTCIQNLDDGWGLLNVQRDIIKPAVLHQEQEDIQTVVKGTLGLCFKPAGLIWVILGPEPVPRVGVHKKVGR